MCVYMYVYMCICVYDEQLEVELSNRAAAEVSNTYTHYNIPDIYMHVSQY
jgi:hypothetical protein